MHGTIPPSLREDVTGKQLPLKSFTEDLRIAKENQHGLRPRQNKSHQYLHGLQNPKDDEDGVPSYKDHMVEYKKSLIPGAKTEKKYDPDDSEYGSSSDDEPFL